MWTRGEQVTPMGTNEVIAHLQQHRKIGDERPPDDKRRATAQTAGLFRVVTHLADVDVLFAQRRVAADCRQEEIKHIRRGAHRGLVPVDEPRAHCGLNSVRDGSQKLLRVELVLLTCAHYC